MWLHAQEGVTLPFDTLSLDVANGTYIKDLDNTLDPYAGAWRFTYVLNGLNLQATLTLTKLIKAKIESLNGDYYYRDALVGTLTIINIADQSVYYTTGNGVNYWDFHIHNMGRVHDNKIEFCFSDNQHCYSEVNILFKNLQTNNNVTTVTYAATYGEIIDWECPYNQQTVTRVLPKGIFTLTKQ